MNRNGYREEKPPCCYFHPAQVLVGVCPLCLNERLLILAAKQGGNQHHHRRHRHHSSASSKSKSSSHNKNEVQSSDIHHRKTVTSSSIHKIFAFGNSLFTTRPESQQQQQQWKSEINNHQFDISPSPEDSFISIKFEENGVASWEKSKAMSLDNNNNKLSWTHNAVTQKNKETNKSVIEHGKSRDLLRWRKRIGHMFQLIRWKRGVCHVGTKVEGVKVRKSSSGWMKTLTLTKRKKKTVE